MNWPLVTCTCVGSQCPTCEEREGMRRNTFLSFDLFFNQIKFLITLSWNEIIPLKSFQMGPGK